MKLLHSANSEAISRFTTSQLRDAFLIESLFVQGKVELTYWETDRTIIGAAVPTTAPLKLEAGKKELAADYFLERREIGILNIGGPGQVEVDGTFHQMDKLDILYVGKGSKSVSFHSQDSGDPAFFYLLSYPAHTAYPTRLMTKTDATAVDLGSSEGANRRTIHKYIHADGIKSCQLVMGITCIKTSSIWNTMPSHTHLRRSEAYLYFDMAPDTRIIHLMGEPNQTRHLVVADKQAILSPVWSIHSGAGTANYSFCWGMGGENQDFTDMDAVSMGDLR